MSHFSVLVVTATRPIDGVLDAVLQPFHEFECTGVNDRYVVEVDVTDEQRAEYQTGTVRRLKDAKGATHDPHDDRFYRDPTDAETAAAGPFSGTGCGRGFVWHSKNWDDGLGYRAKILHAPEGFEEVEVTNAAVMTFEAFAISETGSEIVEFGKEPDIEEAHKYGYILVDEAGEVTKIIRRTNPNKRWDWWQLGGRYSGRLHLKVGASAAPLSGRMVRMVRMDAFDAARVGDFDLAAMSEAQREVRRSTIAEIMKDANATREEVEKAILLDPVIHATWMTLSEPKPRGREFAEWAAANHPEGSVYAKVWLKAYDLPKIGDAGSLDVWIDTAPALTTWAVLKDGEWTEKGSMGWFGMSSGDKDEDEWQASVTAMLAGLPADAWVSVVDCHI